jgi:uncharacterized protein (UPF0261 family)
MPSIVDVAGFKRLSRAIYTNAAGAIAGMIKTSRPAVSADKLLIADGLIAGSFDMTTTELAMKLAAVCSAPARSDVAALAVFHAAHVPRIVLRQCGRGSRFC